MSFLLLPNLRALRIGLPLLLLVLNSGCATSSPPALAPGRQFSFEKDTVAYPNQLAWEYHLDPATGKMKSQRRQPKPDYALHCFVIVHAARQFYYRARFDPDLPKTTPREYQRLIQLVLHGRRREPVRIPGYSSLREFSQAQETLLKQQSGSAWHSYFQRGNWRMIFPFSRAHQARIAQQLSSELDRGALPIVHLVRFPQLTINHGILLYHRQQRGAAVDFIGYDPNNPASPVTLEFDSQRRQFSFPANSYFAGGSVDVYEIYRSWNY